MRVSALITNYNYARFLAPCLDSVLAQTYPDVEIVVVDDGSTDDSRAVLRRYQNRVRVLLQDNAGQAGALSAGFAVCTGDVICLLDSDDGWYAHKVERVVAAMKANSRALWLRHKLQMVGETLEPLDSVSPWYRGSTLIPPNPLLCVEGLANAGTALAMRRELAERVFPLVITPELECDADDAILLARIFAAGAWGYSLDEVLGYYRRHAAQRYGDPARLDRLLRHEIGVAETLPRVLGSRRVPSRAYKYRAVVGALEGAHWWDGRRLGNLLRGLGATIALWSRPRLMLRQAAALGFAFAAPRVWLRRIEGMYEPQSPVAIPQSPGRYAPMKVALLTNFIPPYRVPMFRALAEQVGQLRIFASTSMEANRAWKSVWADLDVVVQKTWTLKRTWRHEAFEEEYELHIPLDTLPQLARWRPDVLITAELGARSAQALLYGKLARKPVVLWATVADHLEDSRGSARALYRRAVLRLFDHVLVNGKSGAAYMARMGVPPERVTHVPYTTDLAPFVALPLERSPDAARRFLYVGALSERKGVRELFAGFKQLAGREPERRLELIVVGTGPLEAALRALPLPQNLHVDWAGHVDYDDLPSWYGRAGILVFPTLGDEWGLVVNEAMAAGVPVLGSTLSGAVIDLLRDGENGWVFELHDATSITVALQRTLEMTDQRDMQMRRNARDTALQLQPRDMAARLSRALRKVCRESSSCRSVGC